ncbi:hypothetical protein HYPSUDRAFT_46875 [Hypholoma sublateritium FD-334 SS-4]|uniref:Uncharacterized protein n=1 Tax=Hypholoma sublateritium (strain FD-334 SS-4) TaxID=945553 RepID=A0A0D2P9B4_HYPSF|nr:hypothetical protein HYPSUDRAFT_46875 [Hypholoma sublateritium FD-334 SS-4]
MSFTTPTGQVPYINSIAGYFDDDLINVPQAQDSIVYAGYTLLDEELGLINAYEPPAVDMIDLEKTHNPALVQTRKLASIKMEALDNGSGRLRGSPEFVQATRTRRYDDAAAQEASLQSELLSRLLGPRSPQWRATHGPRTSSTKERYMSASPNARGVQRTVRSHSPVAAAAAPAPPYAPNFDSLLLYANYDGMHPTETLLRAHPAPVACIDPVLLDPSAWHTDYRMEGLQQMIGSSFVFPLSDVPVPGLEAPKPPKAPKKSTTVTVKIAKAVKVLKDKKPGVRKVGRPAKAANTIASGSGLARRNSLAARSNTLF